jgi:hypothetical protein
VRRRWAPALLVALVTPILLGATDPAGDVGRCPSVVGSGGDAPDLIAATGEIVELGTSARFTLRFAESLVTPDREGTPFRVDVVLRDPAAPVIDAGLYRGVNRVLRYDAVTEPLTTILLLPDAGQSRFLAPEVDGRTLVMQVPGRTLSADEDDAGTSPGLDRLRWGVVVRDERACDLLGNGRATYRLVEPADVPDATSGAAGMPDEPATSWILLATLVGSMTAIVAVWLGRRGSNARPASRSIAGRSDG